VPCLKQGCRNEDYSLLYGHRIAALPERGTDANLPINDNFLVGQTHVSALIEGAHAGAPLQTVSFSYFYERNWI